VPNARNLIHPAARRPARAACALLLAGGALLVGCDQRDDASAAIEEGQRILAATHLAGATPTSEGFRETQYAQAVNAVRPATQQGTEVQRAAAHALLAQAQAGQAELLTERALVGERDAMREASRIRAAFEHLVVGMRAQAAAGSATSTTEDQRESASQIREVEASREEHEQRLADLRSEMDGLRRQIAAAEAAAREAQEREASLRSELLRDTQQARPELVTRAVGAQRDAAGHERERAILQARLDVLRPEAEQVQREIDSFTRRVELLNASRQRMRSLDEAMREQASEDRAAADDAARTLAQELTALDALRQSELADAYDAALDAHRQAVASMRQADGMQGDARTAAMITLGSLQQSLGDLYAARMRGQQRYAALLDRLLEADPPLPEAQETIARYRQRVRDDIASLLEQARVAYEDARASYQRSGARGPLRDRLDALSERLEQTAPADEPATEAQPDAAAG